MSSYGIGISWFLFFWGAWAGLGAQDLVGDSLLWTGDFEDLLMGVQRTDWTEEGLTVDRIDRKGIEGAGALRLDRILSEQTGLQLESGPHGLGLQLRGLSSDYTLILLDGEPLIGRTAGIFDLSRMALGMIGGIEIMRGSQSFLYGSEALAGVINLQTQAWKKPMMAMAWRLSQPFWGNVDFLATGARGAWDYRFFVNGLWDRGYRLDALAVEPTAPPQRSAAVQARVRRAMGGGYYLHLPFRWAWERRDLVFETNQGLIQGPSGVLEGQLSPSLTWEGVWSGRLRLHSAAYSTNALLRDVRGEVYEAAYFQQYLFRPEWQVMRTWQERYRLGLGAGGRADYLRSDRYTSPKAMYAFFAWLQAEYRLERCLIQAGLRFDQHNRFGSDWGPRLAVEWLPSKQWAVQAQIGRGFKVPDFRQIYLHFRNGIAGYAVFGAAEMEQALANLASQGPLQYFRPIEAVNLEAERAWTYQLGLRFRPKEGSQIRLNLFRNDLSNMIETQIFAQTAQGFNIFGYLNLASVWTQGLDLDYEQSLGRAWSFSLGYAFLDTGDRSLRTQVKQGRVFVRDPQTLQTQRLGLRDYRGLFGRSRHSANLKLFYHHQPWGLDINSRIFWRSPFALFDGNGNGLNDAFDAQSPDYYLIHLQLAKTFMGGRLRLEMGLDNLANLQDAEYWPHLAGRVFWLGGQWQFWEAKPKS